MRGELKRAARLAGAALAFSDRDRDRWRTSPHLAPAHAALAICAFEWGDAEGGAASAEAAHRAADAAGDQIGRAVASAVAAWAIGRARSESTDEMRAHLAAVTSSSRREPGLPLLRAPLRILRSRLELAAGDLAAAAAAVAVGEDEQEGEILVGAARVALARDDVERATELLARVLDGSVPVLYGRARVEAAVLQSLAFMRAGDLERARSRIEHALDLAEPEAMRGPFLDAAPGVVEPLRLALRRGTSHRWLAAALLSRWPSYVAFVTSFATIGIMWLNHHRLFTVIRNVDHGTLALKLYDQA